MRRLPPTVYTILFCMRSQQHASGLWLVQGVTHRLLFEPGRGAMFGVYVVLDDLHGRVDGLRWDFFLTNDAREKAIPIAGQAVVVNSAGPNDPGDFGVNVGPLPLPRAGVYCFEISMDGKPIGRRFLPVDEAAPEAQG